MDLINQVKSSKACPPSDRLLHLTCLAKKYENKDDDECDETVQQQYTKQVGGIDLDFETEAVLGTPEPGLYETVYVTSHKAPCRAGAFSKDGQLVATGSADSSIKILDVEKMIAKSIGTAAAAANNIADDSNIKEGTAESSHPVIRTLYDHLDEVTCLEFHPKEQILASGSMDQTIKIYDFAKPAVKRAIKTISESTSIRSLSFHPGGDYLLVGCNHQTIRLYNVNTAQCYASPSISDYHKDKINQVKFNSTGKYYVSCSKDGDIIVWDGCSSKCVQRFPNAHDKNEVCSVYFSRNGKYILSSGKDSLVKLWELSMSRCLIAYTGAGTTGGKQEHRSQGVFNHTEDFVMLPDEKTTSLCVWDSRNAQRQKLLSLGHNQAVRYFEHSPTTTAFLTCSDDFRARAWIYRN